MDILQPWVFTGMLFGAMMLYAFAAPAPVVEYIAPAPAVLYAAPAQESAPLAYAAPVAAGTVGFGSFLWSLMISMPKSSSSWQKHSAELVVLSRHTQKPFCR